MSLLIDTSFLWNETVWNPSMISTALWLDAADAATVFTTDTGSTLATNGSAVGRWNDKSGNGRNATQATAGNRPAYTSGGLNARNVLTLDGTDDWFGLSDATNPTGANATFAVYVPQFTAANGVIIGRAYFWGSWYMQARDTGASIRYDAGRSGVDQATSAATGFTNNTAIIATGVYDKTNVKASGNGGTFVNAAYTPDITYNASDATTIGASRTTANAIAGSFKGLIAEIVVLHSAPSQAVIEKMQGYLAHKWGLGANLPNDHPYKTVGPKP